MIQEVFQGSTVRPSKYFVVWQHAVYIAGGCDLGDETEALSWRRETAVLKVFAFLLICLLSFVVIVFMCPTGSYERSYKAVVLVSWYMTKTRYMDSSAIALLHCGVAILQRQCSVEVSQHFATVLDN